MNTTLYFCVSCVSLMLLSTSLGYLQLAIDQPVELADAEKYHQQKVKVRGFLYQNKENELILANRPDLKSCCIGSQALINQQLLIRGPLAPSSQAITLSGIFQIDPQYDIHGRMIKLYVLNHAEMVPEKHSYWTAFPLFLVLMGCVFLRKRNLINSSKVTPK